MGRTPFSLVALLQTLACYIGGHTHTPESLAVEYSTNVLCFTRVEKCFFCRG